MKLFLKILMLPVAVLCALCLMAVEDRARALNGGGGEGISTGRVLGVHIASGMPVTRKFKSAEQVIGWINNYQDNPDPELVPDAIRTLDKYRIFEDLDQAGLYIGFLAGVLGDNQILARHLITRLFPMNPKSQAVIITAIAYSGLPEWRLLLTDFAERMPQRTVLIDKFLFGSNKPLQDAPLDQSPDMIDALWGFYIATGSLQPVGKILQALRWTTDTDNTDHFALGHMAKWSLVANAERDRPLLRFYRTQLAGQPEEIAKPLKEVIHSAERFEAARVKKTVVAAIAAQKRSKPGKYSKWAWPAKAGETLLAVGCVTATALGQSGLAAPCIVTGAIYSGVRKMMFEK